MAADVGREILTELCDEHTHTEQRNKNKQTQETRSPKPRRAYEHAPTRAIPSVRPSPETSSSQAHPGKARRRLRSDASFDPWIPNGARLATQRGTPYLAEGCAVMEKISE